MTWMRAAIIGKDDERFLGDEKDNPSLKAVAQPPAKPATSIASAKPRTAPFSSGPEVKPAMQAQAKPAARPTTNARPQVKPALPPQFAPAKSAGIVKPALNSSPNPPIAKPE
jgi:hypothetical protein